MSANDVDEGSNALLTYSITEGDSLHSFEIHPVTGEISVRTPLDREMVSYNQTLVPFSNDCRLFV